MMRLIRYVNRYRAPVLLPRKASLPRCQRMTLQEVCELHVQRRGRLPMPLECPARHEDGSLCGRQALAWNPSTKQHACAIHAEADCEWTYAYLGSIRTLFLEEGTVCVSPE